MDLECRAYLLCVSGRLLALSVLQFLMLRGILETCSYEREGDLGTEGIELDVAQVFVRVCGGGGLFREWMMAVCASELVGNPGLHEGLGSGPPLP